MIVLYHFMVKANEVQFDINPEIAKDLDSDTDFLLNPLVKSSLDVLQLYKDYSKSTPYLVSGIHDERLVINFSSELGQQINDIDKQLLYQNGTLISGILMDVMKRKMSEIHQNTNQDTTT